MAAATTPKILLVGATGYVGGTVLASLLDKKTGILSTFLPITLLVRGVDRVKVLTSTYGEEAVQPVLYDGVDDLDTTAAVAAQHDIVINTAISYHTPSAQAILRGLAQRKASTGRDVWMFQIAGTSNIADRPFTQAWIEKDPEREFDDAKDDIYAYEKEREAHAPYAQRTAELAVVDGGLELGVKTLVIMPGLIYGVGTGLFNKNSIQMLSYMKSALHYGFGTIVGDGSGVWGHVHVRDLAELYKIAVLDVVENGGKRLPSGKKGIIFADNGRSTWLEVAQGATTAVFEEGKIKENQVQSVDLKVGAVRLAEFMGFDKLESPLVVDAGLSSTARTVSSVAKSLGWTPTRGDEAWKKHFGEELKILLAKTA
ncbi:NAD dependent epimerase/dehydratase family protein [Apodospora peruviana]|uniref:NAD dependent epimerase/dehydratase family protein n=1 Tax=Apodospora peruviana TaxID=516989 RepID=A0AAE0MHQ5_9PEZI|nr:NAD dependent epimerase/dehydratase family protein [Apodospora peruviana]